MWGYFRCHMINGPPTFWTPQSNHSMTRAGPFILGCSDPLGQFFLRTYGPHPGQLTPFANAYLSCIDVIVCCPKKFSLHLWRNFHFRQPVWTSLGLYIVDTPEPFSASFSRSKAGLERDHVVCTLHKLRLHLSTDCLHGRLHAV